MIDLQETFNDLLQDAVLLEAMVLWAEQEKTSLRLSADQRSEVFQRLFDYLGQHIQDLGTAGASPRPTECHSTLQ